jgi:hypothetical protein
VTATISPAQPIRRDPTLSACGVCHRPIPGPSISDPETGVELHPACLAQRLPEDALFTVLGFLALLLAPAVVVWAG